MIEIWYAILVVTLAIYLVLDGWNIGTGVVHYVISRDQEERRLNLRALGSSWSWHEVWLIGFGGILFMSFPSTYASAFSGFYFIFFILLWALILRGISIEVRNMIKDSLWRSCWDGVFSFSSTVLAFIVGITAANVIRGVPLNANGDFILPLFTNFDVHGNVGLIDWFSLPIGLFTILVLGAHGAGYVAWKSQGPHRALASRIAHRWWIASICGLPLLFMLTIKVRPGYLMALVSHLSAYPGMLMIGVGLVSLLLGIARDRQQSIFSGGCSVLIGLVCSTGAAIYPIMLFSTTTAPAVSAMTASIPRPTLAVSLLWWFISAILIGGYFYFVIRSDSPENGETH